MPSQGPYIPPCAHTSTMSQEEQSGDELFYVITCLECNAVVERNSLGKIPGTEEEK